MVKEPALQAFHNMRTQLKATSPNTYSADVLIISSFTSSTALKLANILCMYLAISIKAIISRNSRSATAIVGIVVVCVC